MCILKASASIFKQEDPRHSGKSVTRTGASEGVPRGQDGGYSGIPEPRELSQGKISAQVGAVQGDRTKPLFPGGSPEVCIWRDLQCLARKKEKVWEIWVGNMGKWMLP